MCKEHLVLKYVMIKSAKKDVFFFFTILGIFLPLIDMTVEREGGWHVAKGHPV